MHVALGIDPLQRRQGRVVGGMTHQTHHLTVLEGQGAWLLSQVSRLLAACLATYLGTYLGAWAFSKRCLKGFPELRIHLQVLAAMDQGDVKLGMGLKTLERIAKGLFLTAHDPDLQDLRGALGVLVMKLRQGRIQVAMKELFT